MPTEQTLFSPESQDLNMNIVFQTLCVRFTVRTGRMSLTASSPSQPTVSRTPTVMLIAARKIHYILGARNRSFNIYVFIYKRSGVGEPDLVYDLYMCP
jgi:hypothetical protein